MRKFTIFSKEAVRISSRLADCKGCTICCEQGGLVYVLKQEANLLKNLGVPLFDINGVDFIQRLSDGSCPMLNRKQKKCTIYEHRPLCCRLYPLDAISIDGQLRWVLATLCPEDRKYFGKWQGPDSKIGSGSITHMASHLGTSLKNRDVAYIRKKEAVSAIIELLDDDQNAWIPLSEI